MINSGFTINPTFFLLPLLLFGVLFFLRCQPGEDGTGGPILVVTDVAKNPFSRYTTEILRAEGFNEFDAVDIKDLDPRMLAKYDVTLLGNIPIDEKQITQFKNWTIAGGTLILFKPDSLFLNLCGIKKSGLVSVHDKYLLVDSSTNAGAGIVNETIQFHGEADTYVLDGASDIATIFLDAENKSTFPAVTVNNVGKGFAIAFAFDLARSIVLTRQGNPKWQGIKRDGTQGPVRSDDLFYGAARNDSLPDYVDFNKIDIPQADELQRFLVNIMMKYNNAEKPLPRFWYLPNSLKAAMVMTGDDHGNSGTASRFEKYMKAAPNDADAVKNWYAVRATSYIYANNQISSEQLRFFQEQGFEIALHLNTHCENWTPKLLDDEWVSQMDILQEKFPVIDKPVTGRTHCMCWSDWASQAKVQAAHGVRLDVNYYYWPGEWVKNRPGMFTGSGIPLRFADINGNIIDCYQAPTQLTDETGINYASFVNRLLDNAIGEKGYYGAFVANMHTDKADHRGSDIIVAAAQKRNIPIISAKQLLTWIDGRSNSSFGSISWNNNRLRFYILTAPGADNLKAMLPIAFKNKKLVAILMNETPIEYKPEVIKGVNYAFFGAQTGNYTAIYAEDKTGPLINNIVISPNNDSTATITWKTDEPSSSVVEYYCDGSEKKRDINNTPKRNHSLVIRDLLPDTVYNLLLLSQDETGNSATVNSANGKSLRFKTPGPVKIDRTDFSNQNSLSVSINELTLKPIEQQSFSGNIVRHNLQLYRSNRGSMRVEDGMLTLDGAGTASKTAFKPGMTLEFEAVFQNETHQSVGFALKSKPDSAIIRIGTTDSLNGVFAQAGNNPEILLLHSSQFYKPHHYRIEWKATRFVFYVDNIESATIPFEVADSMNIVFNDPIANKELLQTNWYKVTPYTATTFNFESAVFDAGVVTDWNMISWLADTSEIASVKVFCRTGNTSAPNDKWTLYTQIKNRTNPFMKSRFIQYKIELTTKDLNFSPVFKQIRISGSDSK